MAQEKFETPKEYQELVKKSAMKTYTNADKKRLGMEPVEKTEIFRQSPWKISKCGNNLNSKYLPVIMVPSLINRNYIMDLLKGHSLIESMVNDGLDVYLIDWGDPHQGMGEIGFDHYVSIWLKRAIRKVKKITGAKQVNLAGQCLGGIIAALYAAHPELKKDVKKLFLLTTPLDLEGSGLLAKWTSQDGFDIEKMTSAFQGTVPADFFHASFPFLDPKKQLSKYRNLLENFKLPGFKEIWEALDIWANDNVDFSKKSFLELIQEFYQHNSFKNGTFKIKGHPVSIQSIDMPVLSIVAKQDHVFTEKAASAIKLSDSFKRKKCQYHVLDAGHVSVIVAHPVRQKSYKLVNEFFTSK